MIFGSSDTSSQRLSGSATAYYLFSSAPSYITIFPKNDLIVLQFDEVLEFDETHLFDLFPDKTWGTEGVLNPGIEYNIDWGIRQHNRHVLRQSYYIASSTLFVNLWIVDHNLKRREGTPPQKDSAKYKYKNPEFKTASYANDRKFLKVNLELEDDYMDHWKYLKIVSKD